MHIKTMAFHNLKKFSAISRFKFTPAVYKDIETNILPENRNYRMRFKGFYRGKRRSEWQRKAYH